MSENKRDKFLRLRNKRVHNAAEALRKIGNLANKNSYSYNPEDVQYIYETLNEVITDVNEKFQPKKVEEI